jgi:hypothetical protein
MLAEFGHQEFPWKFGAIWHDRSLFLRGKCTDTSNKTQTRRRKMQRAMSLLMIYLLVLATTPSFATSGAHFFSVTSSINSSGSLVVSFDEAGVGQQTVSLSISASGKAVYACINGGGNHPSASNKQTVNGPVSASGTFAPTKNGRVTGSLMAAPPASTLKCPTGQSFVLASVSYSGITITDSTNGLLNVAATPSSISACFVDPSLGLCL